MQVVEVAQQLQVSTSRCSKHRLCPLHSRQEHGMHTTFRQPDSVLEQIEQQLYSWGREVESNAVEVHIHHLRRKLGAAAIQTVRGVGYLMPREARAR